MLAHVLNHSKPSVVLFGNKDLSWEELYKNFYPRVFKTCKRIITNYADAEDLTQEVFIMLLRKLHTFRGLSSFQTWLHRVTLNVIFEHLRKRWVRSEETTATGDIAELAEKRDIYEETKPADSLALAEAIERLPDGYRAVLVLHDLLGYEHKEIAHLLGINIGTSKSQLHKGRLRLRALFNPRAGHSAGENIA